MPRYQKIPGIADVDLPWEKIKQVGAEGLRNEELLAILLRTGYSNNVFQLSSEILGQHPLEELFRMGREEMENVKGLSKPRAHLLLAAFEFARRALNQGMGILPSIARPADVLPVIADIKDAKKELWKRISKILYWLVVSLGGSKFIFSVVYLAAAYSYFAVPEKMIAFIM